MWLGDSNLGLDRRVNVQPIQTRWLKARATKFELADNILGGRGPSLNCLATSNVGSGAAIQARSTGLGVNSQAHQTHWCKTGTASKPGSDGHTRANIGGGCVIQTRAPTTEYIASRFKLGSPGPQAFCHQA
ncbi:hypothetical protein PSTG_09214 [Puccinia striiformis f. sp. tritici PST-78]|uniref:Uncharacterized protein n=1 Tax=Puccinia striiformis f. sp. tritici PST-78 TaxID=1165861 RepID=A0A0L0VDY9_9BASI|nr:hypothetical protein PSTG_09214 [Puccinia striiformis f. sp. tritici PST-78]